MKNGKASDLSGVVTEMLKASSNICSELITDFTNSIIRGNTLPSEWDDSFFFRVFRRKGGAIDRGDGYAWAWYN